MSTSPRLGYTELVAAQAVPETTTNQIGRYLEQGASKFIFKSRTTAAEPGSPSDGDCYLLTGSPTGTHWATHANAIAFFLNTAWVFLTPIEGYSAWVSDTDTFIVFDGTTWQAITVGNPTESIIVACSDETTALTVGVSKIVFRMPYAFTVTAVRASLSTAQATGSIFTVDVKESGTTIFSTKPTIDNTEKTTTTAATPAVISDPSLADDAEMTVDIVQIGDGTAKGLKVILIGHR